jgi:hypothetical protein
MREGSHPGTRAIQRCRGPAAVWRCPGAPAGTAQASGPAPAVRGEPRARASIAIRPTAGAMAFRNHLLPATAVVAMTSPRPHGHAGSHAKPGTTFASEATARRHPCNAAAGCRRALSGRSRRRLDAGEPTLMPMSGRCASVYLYAALHISDDGYGSQFRLAVSAESLHIAE